MTIESQLERICVALEALVDAVAHPVVTMDLGTPAEVQKMLEKAASEAKKAEPKPEAKEVVMKKVVEPLKKEAPKAEADPETTNKTSFDDLADKVKALGRMNRDAVVTLFKQFGIERLGGLEEKDYITFDVAIAKALNKTNKANEA